MDRKWLKARDLPDTLKRHDVGYAFDYNRYNESNNIPFLY